MGGPDRELVDRELVDRELVDRELVDRELVGWVGALVGVVANHDVPAIKAVLAPIGENRSGFQRSIAGVPTEGITRPATVDAHDLMIRDGHGWSVWVGLDVRSKPQR